MERSYINVYSKLQLYLKASHELFKKGMLKGKYFPPIVNFSIFPLSGQYTIIRAYNDDHLTELQRKRKVVKCNTKILKQTFFS